MKTMIMMSVLIISCLLAGFAVGYYAHPQTQDSETRLPKEVVDMSQDILVIVKESDAKNRTLFLNSSYPYCKVTTLTGGSSPHQQDLAEPNAKIVFFFLEDIEDPTKADNYGDLIIRMNPIIKNGSRKMVVVFYAEGAYEKLVCHKGIELFHYNDTEPTSNYGIAEIDIS